MTDTNDTKGDEQRTKHGIKGGSDAVEAIRDAVDESDDEEGGDEA